MGEFEDFFEDDELTPKEEEKKNSLEHKNEPTQVVSADSDPQTVSQKPKEEPKNALEPGMIDLEAIEGTGGYSFDDDGDDVEQAADSNAPDSSHSTSEQEFQKQNLNETPQKAMTETDSLDELDFLPEKNSEAEDDQSTKTFNHFESEQSVTAKTVDTQNFNVSENSNTTDNESGLSDQEKQKKINEAIANDNSAMANNAEQAEADLFVDLDKDALFDDLEIEPNKVTDSPEISNDGIDFGSDALIEPTSPKLENNNEASKKVATTPSIPIPPKKEVKTDDFDAFESFLKEDIKSKSSENLKTVESAAKTVKSKKNSKKPSLVSSVSFPKIPKSLIAGVVFILILGGGFLFKDQLELFVLKRKPYTAPSQGQLQKIEVIMSKARQEYLYDHLSSQKKSISYLNEVLKIDPRYKDALYLKSMIQSQMAIDRGLIPSIAKKEDPTVALEEFYSSTKVSMVAKAYALLAKEQIKQSLLQFKQLKENFDSDSDISMGLAEVLMREKDYNKAYQSLALIKSGHRRVHFLKAYSLSELGSDRAYEIYMKSIEKVASYHPKLEFLKLRVKQSSKEVSLEEAQAFERELGKNSVKFSPGLLSLTYALLSEVYMSNQNPEKAAIALKNASRNSKDEKLFYKMATLQEKTGNLQGAVNSYQKAYELEPNKESYLISYLQSLRKAGEYKKALSLADAKSNEYQESEFFLYEYALIKNSLLRSKEAIEHLEKAKTLNRNSVKYDIAIATIYMEKDNYEQAYEKVSVVLDKESKNELALIYKGKILSSYHIFGLAKKSLDKIERPYQNKYLLYQALADYYMAVGDGQSLLKLMKQVEESNLSGYEKDMVLARQLIYENKINDVVERLKVHQPKREKDIELNTMLARAYIKSKNYEQAAEVLQSSRQINRGDFETVFLLGMSLVELGQLDLGIESLIRASEIRSKVPSVWFALQEAYIAKDNREKAEYYFKQATDKNPQFLPAYISIADYYFRSNLYKKAKPAFLKVIQMAPKNEKSYYNLALIEKFDRKTEKAKQYFNKVIQLNRNYTEAYIALGILEEEGRNIRAAQKLFEKARSVDPKNPEPYYLLGLSYRQAGLYRQSLSHFQKYLILKPKAKDREAVEDQIKFLRKNLN